MKKNPISKILSQTGCLTIADIVRIIPKCRPVTYKRNEIIMLPGQVSEKLYFIVKGAIQEYYVIDNSIRTTWIHVGGDATISSNGFFRSEPSPYFFEALEKTWLFTIHSKDIEKLEESVPNLIRTRVKMYEDAILNFEKRDRLYLLKTAEERYEAFIKEFPHLANRIPQKIIASFLGIHPTTLSSTRSHQ